MQKITEQLKVNISSGIDDIARVGRVNKSESKIYSLKQFKQRPQCEVRGDNTYTPEDLNLGVYLTWDGTFDMNNMQPSPWDVDFYAIDNEGN